MAREYVEFKEVVELFVTGVVSELNGDAETPRVNIVFPQDAFELFEHVKEHPFVKKGYWTPDITDSDIEKLSPEKQFDGETPTIFVNDYVHFFELLTELVNSLIDHKEKYGQRSSGRAILLHQFQSVLLRMGTQDFLNPEEFLQKQIDFLKSNIWDDYIVRDWFLKDAVQVGEYEGLSVLATKKDTSPWHETSDKITLSLYDCETGEISMLPSVYFGIREENGENVCYIYAIQNEKDRVESKKLSRKLYKLNKGVEEAKVHPGQVLALKTFIEMLKGISITKVRVPARQVLNYQYHEILEREAIKSLERWTPKYLNEIESYPPHRKKLLLSEYEWDKKWASHVVAKEDFIEKAKTEGLYNVFFRVAEQFGEIEILNDPFIEDEYLNIRIKREKVLSKSRS